MHPQGAEKFTDQNRIGVHDVHRLCRFHDRVDSRESLFVYTQ